jgi:hypothetical protein
MSNRADLKNLKIPRLRENGPRKRRREYVEGKYPTPASADASEYTDEESAFLCAVSRFRTSNKVSSPTACQYLWILKQLGYQKPLTIAAGDVITFTLNPVGDGRYEALPKAPVEMVDAPATCERCRIRIASTGKLLSPCHCGGRLVSDPIAHRHP